MVWETGYLILPAIRLETFPWLWISFSQMGHVTEFSKEHTKEICMTSRADLHIFFVYFSLLPYVLLQQRRLQTEAKAAPQDGRSLGLRITVEGCPLTRNISILERNTLGKVAQLGPSFLMSSTCNSAWSRVKPQ